MIIPQKIFHKEVWILTHKPYQYLNSTNEESLRASCSKWKLDVSKNNTSKNYMPLLDMSKIDRSIIRTFYDVIYLDFRKKKEKEKKNECHSFSIQLNKQ